MSKKIIPYNQELKEKAKKLRKQGILSEVLLWKELKGKKILGYDFHRQKPIDNYIVDFYCDKLNLIIEIDGSSHDGEEKTEYDMKRQQKLESFGLTILRFQDKTIRVHIDEVVEYIKDWISEHNSATTHSV